MKQRLVYDLPTRLFHWSFAGLFLLGFVIAQTVDDESALFSVHMLAGFLLVATVGLRILWGFLGTRHARFSNFALAPKDLIRYFKGYLTGDQRKWAGHNPASSWAAVVMMVMALGLGVTGYLMTSGGNKEAIEDVHELLANGFLIVALLHVAGVILHTLRHREMIGLSMIHGRKDDVPATEAVYSARTGVGLMFVALMVVFAVHLYKNYDSSTRSLQLFGNTLQLGELEGEDFE